MPIIRIFILAMMMSAAALPRDARADYDRALEAYLKEDFIQAATQFDRMISKIPDHPKIRQAVYYSALCRLKLDQPNPAIDRLQSLLESAVPVDGEVLPPSMIRLALGMAYEMVGDDTRALTFFESAWIMAESSFERATAREKIKTRTSSALPASTMPVPPPSVAAHVSQKISKPNWVVQVVSAPELSQAEAAMSQLERAGWPVYQEAAGVNGTTFYRVRVGPFTTESEALSAKARLQSDFGISGWVTKK